MSKQVVTPESLTVLERAEMAERRLAHSEEHRGNYLRKIRRQRKALNQLQKAYKYIPKEDIQNVTNVGLWKMFVPSVVAMVLRSRGDRLLERNTKLHAEKDELEQLLVDIHDILFCKGGSYPDFARRLNEVANASSKKPSHWPGKEREEGE